MKIVIETIPHSQHRYSTVGDWTFTKGDLRIKVSEMSNAKYEFLVGIHEAIEAFLCFSSGISQHEVDTFDIQYETNRSPHNDSEPGDSHAAPYYRQHQIATGIERILAAELGVDWQQYEATINEL